MTQDASRAYFVAAGVTTFCHLLRGDRKICFDVRKEYMNTIPVLRLTRKRFAGIIIVPP